MTYYHRTISIPGKIAVSKNVKPTEDVIANGGILLSGH